MLINSVEKDSIAHELGLKKGDRIISIDGTMPKDIIEYSFFVQKDTLDLHVKYKDGSEEIFEIEKDFEDDLGIHFENAVFDHIKPCANKCIFCFVDQQPKGLRESLYVKDDDWRLSYLQGTYITLTNLTKEDKKRIEAFRPSPLYVSIHSTNSKVRADMLKNPRAENILEDLKWLESLGIEIHGQIVLCPGYNDNKELSRTLDDLKKFKKSLKSLAVVPVGVSKYRKERLKTIDKEIAIDTLKRLDEFNAHMKKPVANASDEIFLLAGFKMPEKKYYGKFSQVEDGVGAMRLFLDSFEKLKKKIKKTDKKLALITGSVAAKMFSDLNLDAIEVLEVKNEFFGEKINVAGLITGSDVLKTLEGRTFSHIVLPSVMLKDGTEEFLDDVELSDIRKKTGAKIYVIQNCYNFSEILAIINSL